MASRTLVLIGRTGNGKSSTGNSILGYCAFTAKKSSKSLTKECLLKESKRNCRTINVIDTPGLFDTEVKQSFIEKEIIRCIDLAKDGVHTFILVLSLNRFTDEEAKTFEILQVLFGPKVLDYMMIVFTGGDDMDCENDSFTLEEYLNDSSAGLKRLLRRCDDRIVVFDNKTREQSKKESQVKKLLEIVDKTVEENGGFPYTNELFERAKSIALEVHSKQGNERGCQEQVNLLHTMMADNLQEMKEKMNATRKGLEEKLKCMGKEKNAYRDEINYLKMELAKAREQLETVKEFEEEKCSKSTCSIL